MQNIRNPEQEPTPAAVKLGINCRNLFAGKCLAGVSDAEKRNKGPAVQRFQPLPSASDRRKLGPNRLNRDFVALEISNSCRTEMKICQQIEYHGQKSLTHFFYGHDRAFEQQTPDQVLDTHFQRTAHIVRLRSGFTKVQSRTGRDPADCCRR